MQRFHGTQIVVGRQSAVQLSFRQTELPRPRCLSSPAGRLVGHLSSLFFSGCPGSICTLTIVRLCSCHVVAISRDPLSPPICSHSFSPAPCWLSLNNRESALVAAFLHPCLHSNLVPSTMRCLACFSFVSSL